MNAKAIEHGFSAGPFIGGLTVYPYQLSFGITVRYWPCIFVPSIRIHFLMFKFWIAWSR